MRRLTPGKRTLGQLAKAAGLARASLLYYESLGAGRSTAGYRLYGEAELERLRTIRQFREAGLPLATIRILLAESGAKSAKETAGPDELLEARLLGMCKEVERLRNQQKLLARLLATREFRAGQPCKDKEPGWHCCVAQVSAKRICGTGMPISKRNTLMSMRPFWLHWAWRPGKWRKSGTGREHASKGLTKPEDRAFMLGHILKCRKCDEDASPDAL